MLRFVSFSVALVVSAFGVAVATAQDPGGPRGSHPLLRLFDSDKNGKLSEKELADAGQRLAEFDKNRDGQLNSEEIMATMPPPGPLSGPGRETPRDARQIGESVAMSDLDKEPLAKDDAEQRVLDALAKMRQGPRFANVSNDDGRLLRMLAESVDAKRIIEIGTSTGESATWLALGVAKTGGHVYTHEIDDARADIAAKNFQLAGVDKQITIVRGDAHQTVLRYKDANDELYVPVKDGQYVDILFFDADKEGYLDYLDKLLPILRPGGLVVAHNVNTRQMDPRYTKAITENPALETLILLKEGTGVGVTLKKR